MRILVVSNLFPPEVLGGYEMVAHEVSERLAEKHEILVLTSPMVNHRDELPHANLQIRRTLNYNVISWNRSQVDKGIDSQNIAELCRSIGQFAPDQVLLFNIDGLGAFGIVSCLREAGYSPAIYLGDNIFGNACANLRDRDSFFKLFGVERAIQSLRPIVVSEGVTKEIARDLGMELPAALHVPGWVPDALPTLSVSDREGPLQLVFSSRIAQHKGIWILLAAVKHLISCGETNFHIDVYGAGNVPDFLQRVHAYGLSDHISYRGMLDRDAMIKTFANYEALLFPTWEREPLGLVPFESAAQGCIPVITAQTGAAEWLSSTDCIKIERTPEGLAGAIQALLAMPERDRREWRHRTARHIRQNFGATRWISAIENHLQEGPVRRTSVDPQKIQTAFFAMTRAQEAAL